MLIAVPAFLLHQPNRERGPAVAESNAVCSQCQANGDHQCPDCQAALCQEHTCGACGRCEQHCLCAYQWWFPEMF